MTPHFTESKSPTSTRLSSSHQPITHPPSSFLPQSPPDTPASMSPWTLRHVAASVPLYLLFTLDCCNFNVHACMWSCFSHVRFLVTLWAVAHQAPLSTGFSRQEYWSGLPYSPPEDLPEPGMEPASLIFPALTGRFFSLPVEFPGKL